MSATAYMVKTLSNVYHARFVVPSHLRQRLKTREFRVSTLTKDPRQAKARIRLLKVVLDGLWSLYDVPSISDVKHFLIDAMTNNRKPDVPMPFNASQDDEGRWHFTDVQKDDVPIIGDFLELMNKQASSTPINQVAINEATDSNINEPGKLSKTAKTKIAKLIKEYLKYEEERTNEKEVGIKTVSKILTRMKPFIESFGDKMIGSITPADIQEYRKKLVYYPKNIHKLASCLDVPFEEVVRRSKAKILLDNNGLSAERISEATVDGYMQVVSNFIEYCIRLYAINPAIKTGFDMKVGNAKKGIKRRAFNKDELQKIFDSDYYREAQYNCPYQYWVPLVAAFTGARVNEIAQLTPDDVKQDKDKVYYFDISVPIDEETKSLKNEESKRVVPIHQQLLDLGIIEFVEAQRAKQAKNLFDIGLSKTDKHGKIPSEWFNQKYLRHYVKLTDPAIVFHSFRHRFITSLSQAIIDTSGISEAEIIRHKTPEALILRRIVGHSIAHALTDSRSSDIHTDTYTGELSVSSMKKVIDKLHYDGVHFHPYQSIQSGKKRRVMLTKAVLAESALKIDLGEIY